MTISDGFIYVSEHGTGKIRAFDRATAEQVDEYQTDAESLLGLEVDGEGNIWFVDGLRNEVSQLIVEQTCEPGSVADHSVDIAVGGEDGWRVQDYDDVIAYTGQQLRFNFESFHDVSLMPDEDAYDACDFTYAVRLATAVESPFLLPLETVETLYFADSTGMHCQAGQKVQVNVVESRVQWPDRECTLVVDTDLTLPTPQVT
jgi:hypothetical protein